jgi:SAM-dependent methyltransferase
LLDALCALVPAGAHVADVGAGIGHLSLPLAQRGFAVTAIDPALAMLQHLREAARARGLSIATEHAAAESLPLPARCCELILIADALHFINVERAAPELGRVLAAQGTLAVVTTAFADTPFMRAVASVMAECAPRRVRKVAPTITQLAVVTGATLQPPRSFHDETPVDPSTLQAILRSISFIGPAMNAERFAAFAARIAAIVEPAVFARTLTLHVATRAGR